MTLMTIYIALYSLTVLLCFINRDRTGKHKIILLKTHWILLILLTADIFFINFKSVWLDRLIAIGFLLTASFTFALYRNTLRFWQKIYFGFFIIYPVFAATTFLMDRLFFGIIASPLIVSLMIPEVVFSDKNYDVRVPVGITAPMRLQLFQKGLITEESLGICNDENIVNLDISSIRVEKETKDSTNTVISSNDKTYHATFLK